MGFFLVIKAELVRTFIVLRRYWFATLTSIIIGYGMLMVLIVGFMARRDEVTEMMGARFGVDPERATNAALGFIIGMFAFGIIGIFSQGLQAMAQSGQLEQLCLSPHGLVTNFLGRSLVGAVSAVLSSTILLLMITATVGGTLHFNPLITGVLLALTYANLIGFGFMVGGLVLVFKQTGQIAVLIRMALLFLAFAVSDKVDTGYKLIDALMHAAPITDAAICLKFVLIRDQMVRQFDEGGAVVAQHFQSVFTLPSFYFLLLSCVVWTTLGIAVFKAMENHSRDKGTLGAY
ncbi:MAG: hypothetical protein AAB353_09245 [Candidatus Hydrogenedentota bacterium]